MRSATASRAVSISTGTRLPAPRRRRQTSRPSMSGQPDVEHHGVGRRVATSREGRLAALGQHDVVAAEHERAAQGVAQRAVVVDDQDLHRPHSGGSRRVLR